MQLYYFKGSKPNFGDDLNPWLWHKLLHNKVFNDDDTELFLGVGSIIYDSFPNDKKKIVFGSGYGGYTNLPAIDDSWVFRFVRGKITAKLLNLDEKLAMGDSAILIRSCVSLNHNKKYKISFIPHWESTLYGTWDKVCEAAGIHYINPCAITEEVVNDIVSSELVIAEAMHGAIVADSLRVPWIPVKPIQEQHHMKWYDWASALDLNINPYVIPGSSLTEFVTGKLGTDQSKIDAFRSKSCALNACYPSYFIEEAARELTTISRFLPSMSNDQSIENAHELMMGEVDKLNKICQS
jgi:succinoglycan biosynthesis protein ExoV